jgi:hypothetical protein
VGEKHRSRLSRAVNRKEPAAGFVAVVMGDAAGERVEGAEIISIPFVTSILI